MLHTVLLALIQSATEFLPVSSSAHLILAPRLMNWTYHGLAMDVVLHVGTLFAVMIYFRSDMVAMCRGACDILRRRFDGADVRLTLNLAIATVPALLAGFFLHDHIEETLQGTKIIASMAILFGVLLYAADRFGRMDGTVGTVTPGKALLIGLAQTLALIPGVSRSGITMTAARALGIRREDAARFSMLLSVPTIGAAGAWEGLKIFTAPETVGDISMTTVFVGMAVSFAGGALAISFLMNWLKRSSFAVFAAYRIALGAILFWKF